MIFADSSYFIALSDRKDQWHSQAIRLSKEVQEELLITDLVLAECVTVIGARAGGKAGLVLYDYLIDSCQVVFINQGLLDPTMKTYLKYDGTLSVADSSTLVVMELKGVKTILSFDSDFDKVKGLKRLG